MKNRILALIIAMVMAAGMLMGCASEDEFEESSEEYIVSREESEESEAPDASKETSESEAPDASKESQQDKPSDATKESQQDKPSDASKESSQSVPESSSQAPSEPSSTTGSISEKWDNCRSFALFTVRASSQASLLKGGASKGVMIVTVNLDTSEVKLVSVDPNTYLNVGDNIYTKCSMAYSRGGAQQAIQILNSNLDMDITKCIAISFKGLSEFIDSLGGIRVNVSLSDSERTVIQSKEGVMKGLLETDEYVVPEDGEQLLSGDQAVIYGYTDGKENAVRQLQVVKAIAEQIKKADRETLKQAFNSCEDQILTTESFDDIDSLLDKVVKYRIVGDTDFPREDIRQSAVLSSKGSCMVPMDLEANVTWLHDFLYHKENYIVSDTVKKYSKQIAQDAAPYLK